MCFSSCMEGTFPLGSGVMNLSFFFITGSPFPPSYIHFVSYTWVVERLAWPTNTNQYS